MYSVTDALARVPDGLRPALSDIYYGAPTLAADELLRRGAMAPDVALMAGLASDPVAREQFDSALSGYARAFHDLPSFADEVIVGGGVHAAVYASCRPNPPLVLETRERFGGEFTTGASADAWYLNSRNRPGPIGDPGSTAALNVIPGAPMQPADIGGDEYQTNGALSITVRCALALNATVRTATVEEIELIGNGARVITERGSILTPRVIVATGLGSERYASGVTVDDDVSGSPVYGYRRFMQRIASDPFPLAGLGRVAVVGAGDGARCVIEALTGIGPNRRYSMASLDYVERIDWYGAPELVKSDYCARTRTRYARIGALLPRSTGAVARVLPRPRAEQVTRRGASVIVDGATFDTVILATGYTGGNKTPDLYRVTEDRSVIDARGNRLSSARSDTSNPAAVARCAYDEESGDPRVYAVGPAASLGFADQEAGANIPENRAGIYRLAPRTAALAVSLP